MFEKIIEKLNKAESVGIAVHINPDGDALGSAFSLKNVLESMNKTANVYFCGGVESCLKEIFGIDEDYVQDLKIFKESDMLIALDCADLKRLGKWSEIFDMHSNTAAVDHHITHIEYADDTVVQEISSTCELIYEMYKEMGIKLSLKAAEYLYIGIMTDTGSFKYSSADGNTHRAAAELIDMGVDFAGLSKRIFDTKSKGYFSLYAYAINSLKFSKDGKIAILRLSENDFERFGTSESEASAIVALPSKTEGVKAGVYIRDRGSECKVSLRSSGDVDVARIAAEFGGGGHVCAAGYSVSPAEIDENTKSLIKRINEQL